MLTQQQRQQYNDLWESIQRQLNEAHFVLWAARAAHDRKLARWAQRKIVKLETHLQWLNDLAELDSEALRLQAIAS